LTWELYAACREGAPDAPDVAARVSLLTIGTLQADEKAKGQARDMYCSLVLKGERDAGCRGARDLARRLGLFQPPVGSVTELPPYSFLLSFTFRLRRPYLSRDDDTLYPIDNPVKKDKVFRVPMVAAAGWKGSLRAAATARLALRLRELVAAQETPGGDASFALRARCVVLFGKESEAGARLLNGIIAQCTGRDAAEAEEIGAAFEHYLVAHHLRSDGVDGRQGRLFCYSTIFDRIGLEVINPHDRARRVGRQPILIECVPSGTDGAFELLYVPFDLAGEGETEIRCQVGLDLAWIATAVYDTMTTLGFGAKTSSGYGVTEDQLAVGRLLLNAPQINATGAGRAPAEVAAATEPLPHYFVGANQFHPNLLRPDGELKSEEEYRRDIEGKGRKYSKSQRQLYQKARKRWQKMETAKQTGAGSGRPEEPTPADQAAAKTTECTFTSLSDMVGVVSRLAATLADDGGAQS